LQKWTKSNHISPSLPPNPWPQYGPLSPGHCKGQWSPHFDFCPIISPLLCSQQNSFTHLIRFILPAQDNALCLYYAQNKIQNYFHDQKGPIWSGSHSLALIHIQWAAYCSLNIPHLLPPQGLCHGWALCLACTSQTSSCSLPHFLCLPNMSSSEKPLCPHGTMLSLALSFTLCCSLLHIIFSIWVSVHLPGRMEAPWKQTLPVLRNWVTCARPHS
jgi:hypothetical protein